MFLKTPSASSADHAITDDFDCSCNFAEVLAEGKKQGNYKELREYFDDSPCSAVSRMIVLITVEEAIGSISLIGVLHRCTASIISSRHRVIVVACSNNNNSSALMGRKQGQPGNEAMNHSL